MKLNKKLMAVPMTAALLAGGAVTPFNVLSEPPTAHAAMHEMSEASTPAVELRLTLSHLLSEHAYLAVETMVKGGEGADDFEEIAAALDTNTDDLTNAIESVYGEEAGEAFNDIWSAHIGYFVDYVKATGAGDEAAKEEALEELDGYRADFSTFLEEATEGSMDADAVAEGLQSHIDQLIGSFEASVEGDYEESYKLEREAIHHMNMVGKMLSTEIVKQFPEKFDNTKAVTDKADLKAHLGHLLSEHAGLAVTVMQNGADGSEDFEASAAALANNTDDLSAAIESVYGNEAGEQFKEMWSEHIGYFVDYVVATGEEDEEAKEQALNNLDGYRADFSEFLETATEGGLKAGPVADGLQEHVNQLIGSFESYVAGDYAEAYDQSRDAYAHMYMPAVGLANAIVAQNNDDSDGEEPQDHNPGHEAPDAGNLVAEVILTIDSDQSTVDGQVMDLFNAPFIWEGHTYVPLRNLAETVGAQVSWDNEDRAAIVKAGGATVKMYADSNRVTVDGTEMESSSDIVIRGDHTQVPVADVARILGWNLDYDSNAKTVTLTK
ncbi:copper amine oxidase N-terminal domain-containing protein [Aureibacillus halotolerans]|uniref:Copper amine oxidase-like protein n=1 Tax=Aureibacillus halotolerans TaxID=1508390 RepID=A0A4V3D679_9BACI|nr:copper amine oxidase N-terminal domain-containing protein [Aureibacillus halotolerans]TDQ42717.1 copper amine oxidase-like protein [Aureibacillus halotolerans]